MSQVQEWFNDNPRARPLLMFALLGVFCLGIGVWSTAGRPRPIAPLNTPYIPPATPEAPTMVGETPTVRPAQYAWVSEQDTPFFKERGLNQEPVRKLPRWEEVAHLQESEGWDQVRLADGTIGWVQGKYVQFVKPADLNKPNDAELTVMAFYKAVEQKDYAAAYAYLGGAWKAELDFERFVQGYSLTHSLKTTIQQVVPIGDNRFQVNVMMDAVEMGQQVPYQGTYLVEKLGDDWCMSSGSLTRMGGPKPEAAPPLRVPIVETPGAPLGEDELPEVDDVAPSGSSSPAVE